MRLIGFEPMIYELKARCHTAWLQTLILTKYKLSYYKARNGDRTRTHCVEDSYSNHYTIRALIKNDS